MRLLLVLVGLCLLCVGLVGACDSAPAGVGRADDSPLGDGAATGDEEQEGDVGEEGAPSEIPDRGGDEGVGDEAGDGEQEASDSGVDEGPADDDVDSDDAVTEEDSTADDDGASGGSGGGGASAVGIVPGEAAAEIEVGVFTKQDVESLYGMPAAPLPTVYQYEPLGIIVWFDESDAVESVLLEVPYAGTTAGGNGIGSSLQAFRSEFGHVDVPDQADNFRVWEDAGLAVDFDVDGLARAIQVFLPA